MTSPGLRPFHGIRMHHIHVPHACSVLSCRKGILMTEVKITTLINSFQNFQLIFNSSSEIRIPQSEIERFWDSFFNFKKRYR
jgi:hypothetical protein